MSPRFRNRERIHVAENGALRGSEEKAGLKGTFYMDWPAKEEDELSFSWNGKPLGVLLRGQTGSD